jgi:hypothetical protein
MRNFIARARRAPWTFKQPLTKIPKLMGAPVSDLFVWRNSDIWQTYFELTDIAGLFVDHEEVSERYVTFFFFDNEGEILFEKHVDLICNQRQTIDLSVFLLDSKCTFGTFCVFHSYTPKAVSDLGSFITERGYVSYRHNGSPLRAYVHGNFDAISLWPDKSMKMLGVKGFLPREFRLQHELLGPALYEVGVVNSSSKVQHLSCQILSSQSGEILDIYKAVMLPRGIHIFQVKIEQSATARIIIKSYLVMARPLVFRINNQKMDVFHG